MLDVPDEEASGEQLLDAVVPDDFGLGEGALDVHLDYLGGFHVGLAVDLLEVHHGEVGLNELEVVFALALHYGGGLAAIARDVFQQILPYFCSNA